MTSVTVITHQWPGARAGCQINGCTESLDRLTESMKFCLVYTSVQWGKPGGCGVPVPRRISVAPAGLAALTPGTHIARPRGRLRVAIRSSHRLGGARASALGHGRSVGVVQVLNLALLAVLRGAHKSSASRFRPTRNTPRYCGHCALTDQRAKRRSDSPRRSAATRLSSFRLRRTVREAMAR